MKHLWISFLVLFTYLNLNSNNLQISVPTLNASNELSFTVSWDNSWFTSSAPHNWDGVYLFVKYRDCASTNAWSHAQLSTTVANHSVQAPLMIDPYRLSDGMGLIVRRSAAGSGNITTASVTLKLSSPALGSSYDFQVFGIEMVMIPTGAFYLGDATSVYSIVDGSTGNPLHVTSDAAITYGLGAGDIYEPSGTIGGDIPLAYPVGYDSMYVMKYEISQGQYVAFLNTLASDQATNRVYIVADRTDVSGTWPNYTTLYPYRAMGYLIWQDLTAYLDWSGMRPMTELEFEKICRGPNNPVAGEFAWGTNTITDCNALSNDGTATEKNTALPAAGTGLANYNNDGIIGPSRCGFAAGLATDRLQSGASYYGVMELSGNIEEMCVNIYDSPGLAFTVATGDGYLTVAPTPGFSNMPTWPSNDAGTYVGTTTRGGSCAHAAAQLSVSDRYYYSTSYTISQYWYQGGRGIR